MTQATRIASPVQIALASDANMYTAVTDNVWEEVPTMSEYVEREAAIKALMNDAPEQVGYSREDAADCIRYMDATDVAPSGRLRGVTYVNGKVTAVYIHDTDGANKLFKPIRHGRWIERQHFHCGHYIDSTYECSECKVEEPWDSEYCPNCGATMDLEGGND